jgi:DNA polymerase I-like protein with 3'-5' exonuclease and polymerase domains
MAKAAKAPKPVTIDFETDKIEARPAYPPKPVGVSIKKWGQKPRYYAWGHPTENNCTKAEAAAALREVWDHPDGLLFHNARFDVDVAEVHMGFPVPSWERVHDTLFMLFLDNPHSRNIGLKPAAAKLLHMPPDERDEVAEWLIKNQPVEGKRLTPKSAMAYISLAPGKLVAPYANGDVARTEALFSHLWKTLGDRNMLAAYERERKLSIVVMLDMERRGIRVDVKRLDADVKLYRGWEAKIDAWLRKRLGCAADVNLNSGDQLLDALRAADLVDVSKMGVTKTGKISTNKESLTAGVLDQQVASVLKYLTQLQTCLGTFMEPWLATARLTGGLIFTNWNQVPSDNGGTRTGRFSSSPNFQNIPKEFEPIFFIAGDAATKHLPKCPWKDLPALPLCRSYIVPLQIDHVLVGRDYSQQEPRILAHFEDGALLEQYQANPWIDYHDNAKDNLERIFGRPFKRKPVKNINLGIIYGQGVGSLAEKNGESVTDTKELKDAVLRLYPGLKDMYEDMRIRAKTDQPIRTWGGREYYCEPPMIINGRIRTFDYKMVNVLIQGSAADCTKEAMLRYYAIKPVNHFLILSVHDELVLSCPADEMEYGQAILRQAMESVEFDVKILSEGAWSSSNWASMIDYDKKGKVLPVPANVNLPKQKRKVA